MRARLRPRPRVVAIAALAAALTLSFARGSGARVADLSVSLASAPASVREGQTAVFQIAVSGAAGAAFQVDYTVDGGGGPALAGGAVQVGAADTAAQLSVQVPDDGVAMDDRPLTVTLTSVEWQDTTSTDPTPAIGAPASLATTIVDADWRIGAIATTPSPPRAAENGSQTIDFRVSLPKPAPVQHPIAVGYAVTNGTAQLGRDYTVASPAGKASGTLTFAPGSTSVDVQIAPADDGLFGTDRTFTVTFSSPSGAAFAGAGASEQATGTVAEADPPPHMGISNCAGGGKVDAGGVALFPVLLAGMPPATTLPSFVAYTTADGTTQPGDYEPAHGTITIPAGQREFDLHMQTHPGPAGDRSFRIQLSSPRNVVLDDTSATCTIHNASSASAGGGAPVATVAIASPPPVTEPANGSTRVTLSLSLAPPTPLPSSPAPVTVHWQTRDGTAKGGSDFTAAAGDVTWPAGSYGANPQPVAVDVLANAATTAPVSFTIVFSSSNAGFSGPAYATITIVPESQASAAAPLLELNPLPIIKPRPLPAPQSQTTTSTPGTHFVLVQLLNGSSRVDTRGRAVFRISCPQVAVRACVGTAVFEVRVKHRTGKKAVFRTIRVATGAFSVRVGRRGALTARLTGSGFLLLRTYKSMRVKATLSSRDASGARGVTAWLVSLQAPPGKPRTAARSK